MKEHAAFQRVQARTQHQAYESGPTLLVDNPKQPFFGKSSLDLECCRKYHKSSPVKEGRNVRLTTGQHK